MRENDITLLITSLNQSNAKRLKRELTVNTSDIIDLYKCTLEP